MLRNGHTIEIEIRGRGGQGAKTAGTILTYALYEAGLKPHGQPRFTPDRMGAPVSYAIRFNQDQSQIFDRSWIKDPQMVMLFDLSLVEQQQDLLATWRPGILMVVNSPATRPDLDRLRSFRCFAVDAGRIALENRLMKGCAPMVSSAMLGAFARVSGLVRLDGLLETWRSQAGKGGASLEANLTAIRRGFEEVQPVFPTPEERR